MPGSSGATHVTGPLLLVADDEFVATGCAGPRVLHPPEAQLADGPVGALRVRVAGPGSKSRPAVLCDFAHAEARLQPAATRQVRASTFLQRSSL